MCTEHTGTGKLAPYWACVYRIEQNDKKECTRPLSPSCFEDLRTSQSWMPLGFLIQVQLVAETRRSVKWLHPSSRDFSSWVPFPQKVFFIHQGRNKKTGINGAVAWVVEHRQPFWRSPVRFPLNVKLNFASTCHKMKLKCRAIFILFCGSKFTLNQFF